MPGAYLAHGLLLHSHVPLPELPMLDREADVVVCGGDLSSLSDREPVDGCIHATPDQALFLWEGAGRFLVRGGNQVVVDPIPGVDDRVLRLYLLGPVLAVLLQQRRRLVLHGSAVMTRTGAAAFLGESGAGKSTLAAGLYQRGYPPICDDILPIDLDRNPPTILPGFPLLKIWPDVALELGYALSLLPRLHPDADKRALKLPDDFFRDAPPALERIYIIERDEVNGIERLAPRDAMIELIRHSYAATILERMGEAPANMMQCASLAPRTPVLRLRVRRSLDSLADLLDIIARDLGDPPG